MRRTQSPTRSELINRALSSLMVSPSLVAFDPRHALPVVESSNTFHKLPTLGPPPVSVRKPYKKLSSFALSPRVEVSALSDGVALPAHARTDPHAQGRGRIEDEDPACEQSPLPPRGGGGRRLRPSNRSEAAQLSRELSKRLRELKASAKDFRAEMAAHEAIFVEVNKQVAAHCAERGELLERLRAYYVRSTDVTARLAETSARRQTEGAITSLQRQLLELKGELERTRRLARADAARRDALLGHFGCMEEGEQRGALRALLGSHGHLLVHSDEASIISPAAQVAHTFSRLLTPSHAFVHLLAPSRTFSHLLRRRRRSTATCSAR